MNQARNAFWCPDWSRCWGRSDDDLTGILWPVAWVVFVPMDSGSSAGPWELELESLELIEAALYFLHCAAHTDWVCAVRGQEKGREKD